MILQIIPKLVYSNVYNQSVGISSRTPGALSRMAGTRHLRIY